MSVLSGSFLANKDASPQGYQPILLAAFQFADGSYWRVSTHPFNAGEGGNQYNGSDYFARIDTQDIQALQARSEAGVDRISEVTLHLFNADQVPWLQYEMDQNRGFKGAWLRLALILADIDPSTGQWVFTNDSPAPIRFAGVCDAPQGDAGASMLTVRATTSHNLARVDFPILHVQQRCINLFPRNAAERLAGATDMSDWRWCCGYDPDQAGTDPEIGGDAKRGNTTTPNATDAQGNVIADAAGIFISCGYTKQDCVARGMYSKDSANRPTGRFLAEQWAPSSSTRESQSISYGQGKSVTVFSSRNDAIYNRSYPMLYGTQWVKAPVVANVLGDGNSTRFEVIWCVGDIGHGTGGNPPIWTLLVNGVIIPPIESAKDKKLHRWNFPDGVTLSSNHTGGRNGLATADLGYDSQGDPHGNVACTEVVVYSDLAQSNGVPDVRALVNGQKIKCPNTANPADQATWPYLITTLPPWILLDLLIWANYSYIEIDLQSFLDAANYCGGTVSYIDPFGNTKTHNRFICQFVLDSGSRKANEVIQAVLRSFNGQLIPNSDTGLLQLFIRRTLADQQPAPIAGSNYNTALDSLHANNSLGAGYVAALIDESSVTQDGRGKPNLRGPYTLPSAQCPNRVSFPFQDEENVYSDDSISIVDPDDVARAAGYQMGGAQIDAAYSVLGITNFDQGIRQSNVILAEGLRGNRWGDTRGTYFFDVEVTVRFAHLRVGQIVLFRWQALQLRPAVQLESPHGTGIQGILCRVESIKPTTNYTRVTLTLRWHEDIWYTDLYGQESAQQYSDPLKNLPDRPPYPWKPYAEQPIVGDAIWPASDWSFSIAQNYEGDAAGGLLAQLVIAGNPPVNQLSTGSSKVQPPFMAMQASTANAGGTIPGGITLLMAIVAQDANGKWSALSAFTIAAIPTGTNTNTATTPTIHWDAGTVAWVLYAGTDDHDTLCAQADGSGTPATITINALNVATYGPPDALADSIRFEVKREIHGGIWGDQCSAVASNGDGTGTLTFGQPCPTHQFQQIDATHGYDLSKLANGNGSTDNVPLANFRVIDNTLGVYHVKPDPHGIVNVGDVFELRALATIVSPTTIGNANFVSLYAPNGFGVAGNEEVGNHVRIIANTGEGQERAIIANDGTTLTIDTPWDTLPDLTSRWVIEEGAWQEQPYADKTNSILTQTPAPTVAVLNISNYQKQTILVRALIADQQSNSSLARWAAFREIYLWGGGGTRWVNAASTTDDLKQTITDGVILCDTSGVTAPAAVTLTADIDDTATTIPVSDRTNVANGTYIQIGTGGSSEWVYVTDGGSLSGAGDLTVKRGSLAYTAVGHSNGDTVILPGNLRFVLEAAAELPNAELVVRKATPDINFVFIVLAGGDVRPDGSTTVILPDSSAALGTYYVKFPGS